MNSAKGGIVKRHLGIAVLGAFLGAGASSAFAQVNPGDPVPTGPVASPSPPLIGAGGSLQAPPLSVPTPAKNEVDPNVVHEGLFVWGPNQKKPPGPVVTNLNADPLLGTQDEKKWFDAFLPMPGTFLEHTAAPAFAGHVGQAVDLAKYRQSTLEQTPLEELMEEAISAFFGADIAITPHKHFLGYKPLRARWLRSQWGKAPGAGSLAPEQHFVYPGFRGFEEARLRGARLYCAARRAQFEQGSVAQSLGERPSFSLKIGGEKIDFFTTTSTVTLAGPEKFLGGDSTEPDGAQAFAVPLLLGTRITPVSFLPGFKETRMPLTLVTGDTEVRTPADERAVLRGYVLVCDNGLCSLEPRFEQMHGKEYHTVTHVDGVYAAGSDFHAAKSFLLFSAGPVQVYLDLDLTYAAGDFRVGKDRVLRPDYPLGAWPAPPRTGMLFTNPSTQRRWHDGPWRLWTRSSPWEWRVLPEGQGDPFWRSALLLPAVQPHDVRALTDDDHAFESVTRLTISANLNPILGAKLRPFEVGLSFSGGITGTVEQSHLVREALMAQDPPAASGRVASKMRPITALSVRPRSTAGIGLSQSQLTLFLDLDLFFGSIHLEKRLLSAKPQTLAAYDSDQFLSSSDEQFALRIGTGSSQGQPMTQPAVLSHLAQGEEYDTFDEDVAACLADSTPNPDLPPVCEGTEGSGGPPQLSLCLYAPGFALQENSWGFVPLSVCGDVGGYVATVPGLSVAQAECAIAYLSFLCRPVSLAQPFPSNGGPVVVSRIWDWDEAESEELKEILNQCVAAYVDPAAPDIQQQAEQLLDQMVNVAVCTAGAKLIADNEVLQPDNPTTPPPAKPGPACP